MALILPVEDKIPQFGSNCFLAPNATVIGDVITGDEEGNALNNGPKEIYIP